MTTVDRFNVAPDEGCKAPCRMATTANISLSGIQVIDDVSGAEDDRVLVKNQTDASENGIYVMKSTAWVRAADWNDSSDAEPAVLVPVSEGTISALIVYIASFTAPLSIGTTEVSFNSTSILQVAADVPFTPAGTIEATDTQAAVEEVSGDVTILDSAAAKLALVNTFTKTQKWAKGADIASASALTLGTDGNYFDVTGTTAITSIATVGIGAVIKLHFDAVLTLTHHATDLILPGEANITTAAGDEAEFVEYATGDWRCTNYQRGSNAPVVSGAVVQRVDATPYTTYDSTATTVPFDDTIPQITEGKQFNSVTITPRSATSKLVFRLHADQVTPNTSAYATMSLFKDGTSSALASSTTFGSGVNQSFVLTLDHTIVAGSTDEATYTLRIGPNAGSSIINGNSGGRVLGGASAVRMSVEERMP